jgi:hypothetical protein
MSGDYYNRFLNEITSCTSNRLGQFYYAIVDEMEKRAWEQNKIDDAADAISDGDLEYALPVYGVEEYEKF